MADSGRAGRQAIVRTKGNFNAKELYFSTRLDNRGVTCLCVDTVPTPVRNSSTARTGLVVRVVPQSANTVLACLPLVVVLSRWCVLRIRFNRKEMPSKI